MSTKEKKPSGSVASCYGRRVKRIVCHQGVQIRNTVVTSVLADKQNVEMEVWPMGILVSGKDVGGQNSGIDEIVITYPMIHTFYLFPVEQTA